MLGLETEPRPPLLQGVGLWALKWLVGFLVAFVMASVGMTIFDYGSFSFVFIVMVVHGFFWRLFHKAKFISILTFTAFFVFLLIALRLYIVMGPSL